MNVKRRLVTASLWSLAGTGGQQAFSFLIFIYLARQLSPADIGLVALAMVFLEVFGAISRLGQVETLQRYASLDHRVTSTSFWMLLGSGLLSCLTVLSVAMVLRGYPEHRMLGNVLALLAPFSAFRAWNAVPEGILKHRLDFRPLTIRMWASTLVGGSVGIYLVHLDMGVYALVGQRLSGTIVRTVLLWVLVRWRPRFRFDGAEAKRLLGTGGQIMVAGLAGVINLRLADSITGIFLGPLQLGYLRLGWRFYDIIAHFAVVPVSSVALSTFSKLRDNLEQLKRGYLRLTQFAALGSLPVFFGLGAVADIFVPLVFGEKWRPSIPILQILGFVILPGTINYFFAPLMVAVGTTRVVLMQSLGQVVITALFLAIGARWGVKGVLIAHILRATVVSAFNLHAMRKAVGLDPAAVINTLLPPVVSCAIMVGAIWLAKQQLSPVMSDAPLLALLMLTGAVTYGATLLAGDAIGLWRGYVGSAVRSLRSTLAKHRSAEA